MDFREDPRSEIEILDKVWSDFETSHEQMLEKLRETIVAWRWATGGMFQEHPLFGQADTTLPPQAEPWSPFDRQWIADDDPRTRESAASQHAFDAEGRIVLLQNRHRGRAFFPYVSHCDEFSFSRDRKAGGISEWDQRLRRFVYGADGQIEGIARLSHDYDTRNYELQWFQYEGGICVESTSQMFEVMKEIPHYQEGRTQSELRERYRPIEGDELLNNLVEVMDMRNRVKYECESGQLVRAEIFDRHGKAKEDLLFERKPQRSLEEVSAELAMRSATTICKAAKKSAAGKPYRALGLIYSAEHAHCGLPHELKTVGADEVLPDEPLHWESYPSNLEVTFKRPVLSCLTEFNHRCYARFGTQGMDEVAIAATDVVRAIGTQIVENLKGTKHVTDDFRVLFNDDHGDVEGGEVR